MVIQRKRSRRERKHVVLRARIIATAIELFSRHGLDHITVEKIADVADIGKGTIYNYFRTKEDIVVAYMAGIESLLQARIPDFAASRKPLESVLIDFLRFHFRLKKPYHRFVRIFLAQMFSRTEQFLPYMLEMQKSIDPPLRARRRLARSNVLLCLTVILPRETPNLGSSNFMRSHTVSTHSSPSDSPRITSVLVSALHEPI
jgi:AcrR family transcriptional regulator